MLYELLVRGRAESPELGLRAPESVERGRVWVVF
jgi:hypothetical protein